MNLKKERYLCYFLLILMILYNSQGIIIPMEGMIGSTLLVTILLISSNYLLKFLINIKLMTGLMKLLLTFICINLFYFLASPNYLDEYNIIRQILLNLLPFFAFYYFARKKVLTRRMLVLFAIFLIPILILKFFHSLAELKWTRGEETVVDNAIYPLIGILPFLLLIKRKIFTFGILLLLWFVMIQSNKRAAFICGILAFFFFIYQIVYATKFRYKIWAYFIALSFMIGVTYFANEFYKKNLYLQQRVQLMLEGDSSGRDELIEGLFFAWLHSDRILNYLFGLGFNSSKVYTGHLAHNDWIGILGSFGLMGSLLYIGIWKSLVSESLRKGWDKNKQIIMILSICIGFVASMTFRWYQSPFPFMNAILLPYLLVTKDQEF